MLDGALKDRIGFTYILDKLEIQTQAGRGEQKRQKPFTRKTLNEFNKVMDDLEKVYLGWKESAKLFQEICMVLKGFKDVKGSLQRLEKNHTLDDVELFEIKNFSLQIEKLNKIYHDSKINIENIQFPSIHEVVKLLNPEGKLMPTFYIYESYSKDLKEIRKEKRVLEEAFLKESDSKNQMKLREKRAVIVEKEEKEEAKIRDNLTNKLFKYIDVLEENYASVGKLDYLLAKGKLAASCDFVCKPQVTSDESIKMEKGIHLKVYDAIVSSAREFTPIDVELKKGVTILTGANMGGKTISLTTIVLNMALVLHGFFPFAKKFHCSLPDFISFASGDLQDSAKGISSFGAELLELSEVCGKIKKGKGLIVFDEFARNTNPQEGKKFVLALCRMLTEGESVGVVSTHYDGIDIDGATYYQVIGLKNSDLPEEISSTAGNTYHDIERLSQYMDYRLEKLDGVKEVPKEALKIAKALKIEKEFLDIVEPLYKA